LHQLLEAQTQQQAAVIVSALAELREVHAMLMKEGGALNSKKDVVTASCHRQLAHDSEGEYSETDAEIAALELDLHMSEHAGEKMGELESEHMSESI
jgi:hypothetical protein